MSSYDTYNYDVVVIGAGGAGLRAAIEASAHGVSVGHIRSSGCPLPARPFSRDATVRKTGFIIGNEGHANVLD